MKYFSTILYLLFSVIFTVNLQAQSSNLSIQGVLRKANGTAVENGQYEIIFKLWDAANGGNLIWTETKSNVDVEGGIYSVVLGDGATELDAKFDIPYYLGVAIEGGTELIPRAKLTSSPYALSLIGDDNVFPNSGNVGVGDDDPQSKLSIRRKDAILGLEVDSTADHTATITTIPLGMEFDAGGADKKYVFSNGRIDAIADEQFSIVGTDESNLTFSKNSGNTTLGYSTANGDNFEITNHINNGELNFQSDGVLNLQSNRTLNLLSEEGIALTPTNDPVKINKNGEALQFIGTDSTSIGFYPQGANGTVKASFGFNDSENPDDFKITTSGGDMTIDTKDGRLKLVKGLEVALAGSFIHIVNWNHRAMFGHGELNQTAHHATSGIVSWQEMVAPSFRAWSDQRLKTDFKISSAQKDLTTLMRIEVTDYRHKDISNYGLASKKGFIAQQVNRYSPKRLTNLKVISPTYMIILPK